MTWTLVSEYLQIERRTLFRIRKLFPPEVQLSDEELVEEIYDIKREFPHFGEVYVRGALRSRGFANIPRWKTRLAMHYLDPERGLRRKPKIKRVEYFVPAPHYLWHIDGNEKLQMFHIYIHGCIDGYSRYPLYVKCCSNKLSLTPLAFFYKAAKKFGLPRFVRIDKGTENVQIAEFHEENLQAHGKDKSVFTGPSTRNVRIERFWREINEVTMTFKQFFYDMMFTWILDVRDPIHLFALHYIFLPRIQQALDNFVRVWRCHDIRTAGTRSPKFLLITGKNITTYEIIHDPEVEQDQLYSEDWLAIAKHVVPNPFHEDNSKGVTLFTQLVQQLSVHEQQESFEE